MYTLYFDGASRSNPGPASYGVTLMDPNGTEIDTDKKYIGNATNNVAEYMGAIAAVNLALKHNLDNIAIYGDSNLVIKQITNEWKVKSENLKEHFNDLKNIISKKQWKHISFNHVYRKHNKRADQLANEALDEL
jgi:ribonuclease HI